MKKVNDGFHFLAGDEKGMPIASYVISWNSEEIAELQAEMEKCPSFALPVKEKIWRSDEKRGKLLLLQEHNTLWYILRDISKGSYRNNYCRSEESEQYSFRKQETIKELIDYTTKSADFNVIYKKLLEKLIITDEKINNAELENYWRSVAKEEQTLYGVSKDDKHAQKQIRERMKKTLPTFNETEAFKQDCKQDYKEENIELKVSEPPAAEV